MPIQNLAAQDVARGLADHSVILIDVREPNEFLGERIVGALLFPMSTFDPLALPDPGARRIVFHCGSGMRSARAVAACEAAGLPYDSHLQGGMQSWKAARLPVLRLDPQTGELSEVR